MPEKPTCAICLTEMESKDMAALPCTHSFHDNCITEWFARCQENNLFCPICRFNTTTNSYPEPFTRRPPTPPMPIDIVPQTTQRPAGISPPFFSDIDHRNMDFIGMILRGCDLSYRNLSGANFTGADLSYTNLTGTNLRFAVLTGAKLIGANLTNAILVNTKLEYTNLTLATLIGAILTDATLSHTILNGANLTNTIIDLQKAYRSGAKTRGTFWYMPTGQMVYII